MGNCLSLRSSNRNENNASEPSALTAARRNLPLKPSKPKWKSDIQLTEGQLRSKRDEFWDTAPAFEGRKEIWDALKAAACALETEDHTLAQAIVDGANITLPTGTLLDCYDELGNRYQLPVYVLSTPTNLIDESNCVDESDSESENSSEGVDITIKLRLSTSEKDIKFPVKSKDTIAKLKRIVEVQQGVPISHQKFFFSGKLLNDKTRICDAKIPKGFVIQVIISQPNPTPVAS